MKSILPEHLLEHAAWVRRLARALCADAAAAEDVIQETWLAAIRRARPVRDLGRWLAAVVANAARREARSRERRVRREAAVLSPGAVPSPEEVLGLEESRQRIARTVLALPEPYRSTVLLRFWSDLTSKEIAEREGISASTVRNRLRRGVAQLRVALRDLGQSGEGGPASLAVLLLPVDGVTGLASLLGPAPCMFGGFLMASKLKLVALAATLAALTWGGWSLLTEPGPALPESDAAQQSVSATAMTGSGETQHPVVEREAERPAATAASDHPVEVATGMDAPEEADDIAFRLLAAMQTFRTDRPDEESLRAALWELANAVECDPDLVQHDGNGGTTCPVSFGASALSGTLALVGDGWCLQVSVPSEEEGFLGDATVALSSSTPQNLRLDRGGVTVQFHPATTGARGEDWWDHLGNSTSIIGWSLDVSEQDGTRFEPVLMARGDDPGSLRIGRLEGFEARSQADPSFNLLESFPLVVQRVVAPVRSVARER